MLIDGGGVTERVRGYQEKTNRLPYPHISKQFPGKVETTTPYVIGKIVPAWRMERWWALARSVRALVAECDALKEKFENSSDPMAQEFNGACTNARNAATVLPVLPPPTKRNAHPGTIPGPSAVLG